MTFDGPTPLHSADLDSSEIQSTRFGPQRQKAETVKIDLDRNSSITEYGLSSFKKSYLLDNETPQHLYARVAAYMGSDSYHAQRLYEYMSKQWFSPATPILANAGTSRGMPISCYLQSVEDSMDGIRDKWTEQVDLASKGGGIGTYWGNVRSRSERVGIVGTTSGIVPFLKVQESITLAISQGSLRRGNAAAYLNVWHPEIEEFLDIRKPQGGDPERKTLHLHQAIVIDDKFMQAVENNTDYDLLSPKDNSVIKSVNARNLWIRILTNRLETGEPYLLFIDHVRKATPIHHRYLELIPETSNLCVAPETKVLTDKGYIRIRKLENKLVKVWNGQEWSKVKVKKTSDNTKLLKVRFNDGSSLSCTPHHKFYIQEGYDKNSIKEVRTNQLKPGMKLIKFDLPQDVDSQKEWKYAYSHGFYCGDGFFDTQKNRACAWLYGEKDKVLGRLKKDGPMIASDYNETYKRRYVAFAHDMPEKFKVPLGFSRKSKLNWLAGLIDADGCSTNNNGNQSIQITSINKAFVNKIKLLLSELGVKSYINLMHAKRRTLLSNGNGGQDFYECKAVHRLCISYEGVNILLDQGLKTKRVKLSTKHIANRNASRFVQVKSVKDTNRYDKTFCFTEPKRHMGVFNGVLTGQCSEITLPTGSDHHGNQRTAVCCLSSLNLEKWDEWKDNDLFIRDVMEFLDNVLQDYIDTAPLTMRQAVYAASRERSIGLGVMGFHSYLQSKRIPWESAVAKSLNMNIFKHIKEKTSEANDILGTLRGACPDAKDYAMATGLSYRKRFSYCTAVAPTASISILCGQTSPGIEPYAANAYRMVVLGGAYSVKNQHLESLLEEKGKNTPEVWYDIMQNRGSVQHLDFLTDWEKDVFKTAMEIDQRWLIEFAGDRAPMIDQAQSVNLFLPTNIKKSDLHKLHFMAWKKGLKSLYYCRSTTLQTVDKIPQSLDKLKIRKDGLIDNSNNDKYNTDDECLACQ